MAEAQPARCQCGRRYRRSQHGPHDGRRVRAWTLNQAWPSLTSYGWSHWPGSSFGASLGLKALHQLDEEAAEGGRGPDGASVLIVDMGVSLHNAPQYLGAAGRPFSAMCSDGEPAGGKVRGMICVVFRIWLACLLGPWT